MAVRTLTEEVVPLFPTEQVEPIPPEPVQPSQSTDADQVRAERAAAIFAAMDVASKILAARMLLLLAGAGAFVLALTVVLNPTWGSAGAMAIYDIFVFLPLAWLAIQKG
jgi:hypothetical protein